jgi:lipoate-protein ligase A
MNPISHESYLRTDWRVILHREADGATNMAIDEAIALAVAAGESLPTLRLFAWNPPCLSLGYTQPASDVDRQRLARLGWDVVRRLTGGRAILHTDELTYSVAVPETEPRVAGDVVESYRRLSQGLMRAVELLGAAVQAERAGAEAHAFKGPVCFEMPSDYEITAGGRKLFGSAQTRRGGRVVLQHGTLPLHGDITRICDGLAFADERDRDEARRRILERATTLEDVLGVRRSFDEAAQAMIEGFTEALNVNLLPGRLSVEEQESAERLRTERYGSQLWTFRR